jgi:hypothetical protein
MGNKAQQAALVAVFLPSGQATRLVRAAVKSVSVVHSHRHCAYQKRVGPRQEAAVKQKEPCKPFRMWEVRLPGWNQDFPPSLYTTGRLYLYIWVEDRGVEALGQERKTGTYHKAH